MASEPKQRLDEARLQRRESRANATYRLFLKQLCERGRMSPEFAEQAAVSVLCALEQRLLRDEARHLEAQLPLKLKNLLARCTRHPGDAPRRFGLEEFLGMVGEDLGIQSWEAEPIIRAVFGTVRDQISEGELQDVLSQLPRDLADLFATVH